MTHALRVVRVPHLRTAFLVRSFAVWVGLRAALAAGGLVSPGPVVRFLLLALVVTAVALDARRRQEHLFLGNLGIPAWTPALLATPVPLLAELLLRGAGF